MKNHPYGVRNVYVRFMHILNVKYDLNKYKVECI